MNRTDHTFCLQLYLVFFSPGKRTKEGRIYLYFIAFYSCNEKDLEIQIVRAHIFSVIRGQCVNYERMYRVESRYKHRISMSLLKEL